MATRHTEAKNKMVLNYDIDETVPLATEINHLKAMRDTGKAAMRKYITDRPNLKNKITNFEWHIDSDVGDFPDEPDDLTT